MLNRSELENAARLESENLNELQLIKYQEKPVEGEDIPAYLLDTSTTYAESFPWYAVEDGRPIEYNKPIRLFDGVKLISRYLETRHRLNPDLISETKLTELLELFKDNKNVTVKELYAHVSILFEENESSFYKNLNTATEEFSDSLITEESNASKPFGQYGEVTLNQIGVALKENLKDVNWELVYNQTKFTVHGIPTVVNTIGYGLVLKSYIRYVHNRPMDVGLSPSLLEHKRLLRNRQLALFCIFGAPLTMFLLRSSAIPLTNMFSLSIGGESQLEKNNLNNSSLFLFLSNLIPKTPRWLKILFRFLILTILILTYFGICSISVY